MSSHSRVSIFFGHLLTSSSGQVMIESLSGKLYLIYRAVLNHCLHDNSYYENQGFSNIGDFSIKRSSGKADWLGTLMRMDLQPREDAKPDA